MTTKRKGGQQGSRIRLTLYVMLLGSVFSSLPALAQQTSGKSVKITVAGQVVDGLSSKPVTNALVQVDDGDRRVLTDEHGRFRLNDVSSGSHEITVEQLGYESAKLDRSFDERSGLLEIALTPNPVELEGIKVVSDQLERRRRTAFTSVMAYDADNLRTTAAFDAADFVRQRIFTTPCPRRLVESTCVMRRGRVIAPRVYIDEAQTFAGLDHLYGLSTNDLYLVEVYGNGEQIRVYTNWFARGLAQGRYHLQPVLLF